MVKRDTGHDRTIGLIGIHRIEPPAKTDLKNSHVDLLSREHLPCGQRTKFEIGERYLTCRTPRGFDFRKGVTQKIIGHRHPVNTHAFAVSQQVGRGIATGAISRLTIDRFQVGTGRSFAVGSTDNDHRAVLSLRQLGLDAYDARQSELNAPLTLRVKAFEMCEPIGERFCHRISGGRSV